jgi:hypothetical protein
MISKTYGIIGSGEDEGFFLAIWEVVVKVFEDMGKPVGVGGHGEEVVTCVEESANGSCVVIGITDEVVDVGRKSSDDISHECRGGDNILRDSSKKVVDIGASSCEAKDKTTAHEEEEVAPGMWFVGVEVPHRRAPCPVALQLIYVEFRAWIHVDLVVPIEDGKEGVDGEVPILMYVFPCMTRHHPWMVIVWLPVVRLVATNKEAHPQVDSNIVIEIEQSAYPFPHVLHMCIHTLTQDLPPVRSEEKH